MSKLKIQDTLEIVGNGTAEGSEIVTLSDFSDGVSGYCKLPNGTEMCWDTIETKTTAVTFPQPFSSADNISVVIGYKTLVSGSQCYTGYISASSVTETGFTTGNNNEQTRQYIAIRN